VLEAIGLAGTSGFRLSLGPGSAREDIDALLDVLPGLVGELREVDQAGSEALARFRPPS
jgi:hypothetical protein